MSSPSVLVAFSMTLTLALVSAEDTWLTTYQDDFQLVCPDQTFANGLKSIHDNFKEDRIWYMSCGTPVYGAKAYDEFCAWTDFANEYDQEMNLVCPEDQVMAGLQGNYSLPHRDRRFKLLCCDVRVGYYRQLRFPHAVQVTGFLNDFDGRLEFQLHGSGVIFGMQSYHNNLYEDRRFSFIYGKA